MEKQFVAYFRVSSARQGRSGLGLEAQRESVCRFVFASGGVIAEEFTEIESGRKTDRLQLLAALAACRRRKAVLAIARLDRLARNAAFLLQLRDSNIEFVAADMPHADRLTVGVLALIAERERDMISARTKDALAAAKRRGVKLGSPNPAAASVLGIAAIKERVRAFDRNIIPIIEHVRRAGITSLRGIAEALNARGIGTRRAGRWAGETVRQVLMRID